MVMGGSLTTFASANEPSGIAAALNELRWSSHSLLHVEGVRAKPIG